MMPPICKQAIRGAGAFITVRVVAHSIHPERGDAVLPQRRKGIRPEIGRAIPHLQLDQLASGTELAGELLAAARAIPDVNVRESRMADSETRAIYIVDEFAQGPPEAFIDDHEFCHLHPPHQGSSHLTLPPGLREDIIALGWAEAHPLAGCGLSPDLVTVYAPRNEEERDVVFSLVLASYRFARGSGK